MLLVLIQSLFNLQARGDTSLIPPQLNWGEWSLGIRTGDRQCVGKTLGM